MRQSWIHWIVLLGAGQCDGRERNPIKSLYPAIGDTIVEAARTGSGIDRGLMVS